MLDENGWKYKLTVKNTRRSYSSVIGVFHSFVSYILDFDTCAVGPLTNVPKCAYVPVLVALLC